MLRLSLACLVSTAATLGPTAPLSLRASHIRRLPPISLSAQLSSGLWVAGIDQASGQTYYFNEQTGESQWEYPQTETALLVPGWTTGVDQATGQKYYINEQTGASQWELPTMDHHRRPWTGYPSIGAAQKVWMLAPSDTVLPPPQGHGYMVRSGEEHALGRFDMIKPNPYVSRKQVVVRVAADGVATVTSLGKAQTYIFTESDKPPPGEMIDHTVVFEKDKTHILRTVVLGTGQTHVLQDSDQIVFRQAKFTVYEQQDAQNGWVTGIDEASGMTYYYNERTGESQWEPP
jgi:hypothetical protein